MLASALAWSCAGAQEPELDFPPTHSPPPRPEAVSEPPPKLTKTLLRSEVNALLDAGFPRFLQRVDVEPALEAGRFRGWRIVALRPESWWAPVDLRPGDVVVNVNGMPIERETQAFAAFEALRGASRLTVAYLRDKQPRTLDLAIVDRSK